MNTSEFAKKIAVLTSERNTIWTSAKGRTIPYAQKGMSEEIIGIKYPTIQKWLTDDQYTRPRRASIEKMCSSINQLKQELEQNERCFITKELEESDFSNNTSVFEFASIFGIDWDSCCRILDERIYYWESSLLPSFYYDKLKDASDVFNRYKGFYNIYRRGTSAHNEKDIFIMKLHVRYVLTVHSKRAIRCKLNIPNEQRSLIEYDGFVSEFEDYVYWMFETRRKPELNQRDCIFMLTNRAQSYDSERKMEGLYLSVNQDVLPKPVNRNILLIRKHEELNEDEEKRNFMKGNMDANIIKDSRGVDLKIIERLR